MAITNINTLSGLLEGFDTPNPEAGSEDAADACLVQHQYEEALSGYYQLDAAVVRIATKIAFCEWMTGQYASARDRLFALEVELDSEGIGLLCELIRSDDDYRRRDTDMGTIWPRLKAVIAEDSVPLFAAIARSQEWWPEDYEDRAGRHSDIVRLLALHPESQHIRLAVLRGTQLAGATATEQYALLRERRTPPSMPRYLWEAAVVAANAGEYHESQELLDKLEEIERRSGRPSQQLLLNIDLGRAHIAVKSSDTNPFSGFNRLLSDASFDSQDRLRVIRAALEAACSVALERVPSLGNDLLATLELNDYEVPLSTSELVNEPYPLLGSNWDTHGHMWPSGDLIPYREVLLQSLRDRAQLFVRATFAIADIENEYDNADGTLDLPTAFWDGVSSVLGNIAGSEEEFDGRLLSLDTAIRANRHRPSWAIVGRDWLVSEKVAHEHPHVDTHGWLTLEAAARSGDSLRIFASGATKRLRDLSIPAPVAYDLVEDLAQKLAEHEQRREFHLLMKAVSSGDDRPEVQFYLGLGAQWANQDANARTAYLATLAQQSNHYSAIFNSLLLCKEQANAPFLALIEPFVAQYPQDAAEEKGKLKEAVAEARKRCEDKNVAKRRAIETELARYPSLVSRSVDPADISLRAAVALLALFRCANAEPNNEELPPFDGCGLPFAPVNCRRILFDLLATGLVAVDSKTSINAFVVSDGDCQWRFESIRWRLSSSCERLIQRLRSLNGTIPESWREDVLPLAIEFARGEVTEYLNFLADDRGWPPPKNTEEVSDLTRTLVNELPVAQAFYLAYLGAMAASDYKQKHPVNGQQAADVLVKRAGQRLESVQSGKYQPRAFDRPWNLSRSAVSFALWGTILNMGDRGFTHRIADLAATL